MEKMKMTNLLIRSITNYALNVKEIDLVFKGLLKHQSHTIISPLAAKEQIKFLMIKLKETNNIREQQLEEHKKHLNIIDKKLKKIKQNKEYYEKVLEELLKQVKSYEIFAKHPEVALSTEDEFLYTLNQKEICEALIKELKGKKNITKLKKRIKKTDKEIKKHAKEIVKKFGYLYESKEWDYYPKTYWWRHLKEFIEEKEEKNK